MIKEFNTGKTGPKTHVLIIGVGGYTFLKGGTNPLPQSTGLEDLGQLTSPIVSSVTMYKKIVEYDTKNEWSKPLGSIEILLSPPTGSTVVLPEQNIEKANLANIQKAYYSWKKRSDAHEDNVAIFYYCGHGFQKKHHFLLADDFGAIPQNPWLGAFNFDDTRDAFYSCKAQTQVFFVDACRQVTVEMLGKDLTVAPIENPSLENPEESINHLTLKATASGLSAYGKKNNPTYFTQAIIRGLDGLVAREENNEWNVETGELGLHIYRLLEVINEKQSFKQRCQVLSGNPIAILSRKEAPVVYLEVTCHPDAALPLAGLSCREDEENPAVVETREPMAKKWTLQLKVSHYRLDATFQPGGAFKNSTKKISLIPPIKKEKLICT